MLIFYSNGLRSRSGVIVVFIQGLTTDIGFGGSLRIWRFEFLIELPIVLIPWWCPAFNKLTSLRSPPVDGFNKPNSEFSSLGNKSEGDLYEFNEIGAESKKLNIEKIVEIINSQKK